MRRSNRIKSSCRTTSRISVKNDVWKQSSIAKIVKLLGVQSLRRLGMFKGATEGPNSDRQVRWEHIQMLQFWIKNSDRDGI
jgi:hypothetical protein